MLMYYKNQHYVNNKQEVDKAMKRQWLTEIRESCGLSQYSVAKRIEVTPAYYNYIEHGQRRPSPEVAQRIASVLGFPDTWYRLLKE